MIKLKVTNINELQQRFKNAPRKLERLISEGVREASNEAVKATKDVITSGRGMYRPPVDTGAMRQGIYARVTPMRGEIQPSDRTPYAVFVHEGTRKMRKRPFFEITERTEKDNIVKVFEKTLELNKLI